jgi:light-regulated signal transduction histidine kinase (bacteriophytochrome)
VKQGISVLAAPARRLNFLSVVAHDLRQPMSAALVATQLVESYLDDTSAPPLARKHIAMAQRCMRETLQLASDLLAMEQANAGVLRLRLAPVDVHALLRDAWALVAQDARARSIDVQLRVPRHLPRPVADRDRLLQVLTNLCANAVRFIGRDGRIELSASHDDPMSASRYRTPAPVCPTAISRIYSSSTGRRSMARPTRAWAWGSRSPSRSSRRTADASWPSEPEAAASRSPSPCRSPRPERARVPTSEIHR